MEKPRLINNKTEQYKILWELTKLDKKEDFLNSAIFELKEYLDTDAEKICDHLLNSDKLLTEEWNNYFMHKRLTQKNLIEFYNNTNDEIFELMNWHYQKFANGPLQYVFALDIASRNKCSNYLDYGSGVGTGGILFALKNFTVTLADISSKNLDFCRYRFKQRRLNSNFADLKYDKIKYNTYDIITCFDVLEHSLDPLKILTELYNALTANGLLIINTPFKKDKNKPMHIITNQKLKNSIRSIGFDYEWDLIKEYSQHTNRSILVLRKSFRNFFQNKVYLIYDNCPKFIKKPLSKIYKYFR